MHREVEVGGGGAGKDISGPGDSMCAKGRAWHCREVREMH